MSTFDVFDIQFKGWPKSDQIEVRPEATAFGATDEQYVFVRGYRLGKLTKASEFYREQSIRNCLGAEDPNNWYVIPLARVANGANDPVGWGAFVRALETLLVELGRWRAVCESDCGQYEPECAALAVSGFLLALENYRAGVGKRRPMALVATSEG